MSAVAQLEEAMGLWESGVTRYILILGRFFPNEIPIAIKIWLPYHLVRLRGYSLDRGGQTGIARIVHVNVETGIAWIGLLL